MKNLSTGAGLALLAGAIVSFPVVSRISSLEHAAQAAPPTAAAMAIASVASAQATPTIVWYGISPPMGFQYATFKGAVFRAWSDGRIEYKSFNAQSQANLCDFASPDCGWQLFSDPSQGYNAAADINFDSKVDGNDLGQLLASWGPAPRHDITPSDCPLDLINP